ncbi:MULTISPECIES: uracil-DNA glycosylase [Citricoccus]|uniref:uracil-DNA glycosylase n=1 Tax=Citricoccus TaxID=169133 RepID=UPI00067FB6E6|nr:uracil-DNA glycosylase [Citricoccus sp. CH26A]
MTADQTDGDLDASSPASAEALPHPLTGQRFASPVPPGTGWPEDPALPTTPAAASADQVRDLAGSASSLAEVDARVSVCRACPRLIQWRETVAVEKRRAFADQPYWGRPVPSYGDESARVLVVGLAPAAHGGNRTGRMFTGDRSGDWLFAALHRAGYAERPTSAMAGDGQRLSGLRMVAPVHCAPPDNKPTPAERAACGHWLDRELQLLTTVESILVLGSIGWQSLHAAAARIGWGMPRPRTKFGHGVQTVFTVPGDAGGGSSDGGGTAGERRVRVVGCYHVSQQNTFTGRLTEAMLDEVIRLL